VSFRAHLFIIASRCSKLYTLVTENATRSKNEEERNIFTLVIDNTDPVVFEKILLYLYTNKYQWPNKEYSVPTNIQECQQIDESLLLAKKLGLVSLGKLIRSILSQHSDTIDTLLYSIPEVCRFDRNSFKSLYDVSLESENGSIFQAHKCMLVARTDYFSSMLNSNAWLEVLL